jgi:hypothetical protein
VPAHDALERFSQTAQLGEPRAFVAVEEQLLRRPVPHLDRRAHTAAGHQHQERDQLGSTSRDRGRGPGALTPAPQAHGNVTDSAAYLRDSRQGIVGLDGVRHVAVLTRATVEAQHRHVGCGKRTRQVFVQEVGAPRHAGAVQDDDHAARRPARRHVQRGWERHVAHID